MAEDFVSAFASVLTPHLPPLPHMHQHCDSSFSSIPLSPSIVAKAISALNENGSIGPDLIHPLLLKRCKSAISLPLYLLFNKSLTSASVPSSWKYQILSLYSKKVLRPTHLIIVLLVSLQYVPKHLNAL